MRTMGRAGGAFGMPIRISEASEGESDFPDAKAKGKIDDTAKSVRKTFFI